MPKQQSLELKAKGLYTQYSRLDAPEGALLKADNVVIDKQSVITSRRGFIRYNTVAFTDIPTNLMEYKGKLIALDGTTFKYDNGSGTFTGWTGAFTKPTDAVAIDYAEAQNNIYFTSNAGIYKNDAITGTPKSAGVIEGLDLQYAFINVATGWLANTFEAAYKVVWIKKDANENEIVGPPSPRLLVINSGLAADVRITTTIPSEIITNDYVEIYRTLLPAAGSIDPGDDCYLLRRIKIDKAAKSAALTRAGGTVTATVAAHGLTTGDYVQISGANTGYNGVWQVTVTAPTTFTYTIATTPTTPATGTILCTPMTVTFEDIYNDSFLEESIALYTNTNEEGLESGNYKPPLACSLVSWKGYVWYGNTQREQRKSLKLTSTAGVTLGSSTLTITGLAAHVYTFAAAEDINTRSFQLHSGGTLSVDLNDTVDSLVRVINLDTANTEIYAWRDTGASASPGSFHIFSRGTSSAVLTFISSVGANFDDVLPAAGVTIASNNTNFQNRLYWSKNLKPEAVPLLQYFDFGSKDHAIEAVVALKDSLIVFKTDGVWRITGEGGFTYKDHDLTTFIMAPNSARRLGEYIYVMTNKGVVRVNEYGIEIVSYPIDDDLKKLTGYNNFRTLTSAVAHEGMNDNKYVLWTQTESTDSTTTQAWVFNYLLNGWTKWIKSASYGLPLSADRKLYMCHNVDKYILKERRTFSNDLEDYCDEEIAVSVTAVDNTGSTSVLTVSYSYATVALAKGFLFRYNIGSVESKVIEVVTVSAGVYTVTLADKVTLPAGTFTAAVLLPIPATVQWMTVTAGNTSISKRFQSVQVYMMIDSALYNYINISSNREPTEESLYCPITALGTAGWGSSPWGSSPWGSPKAQTTTPIRVIVPQQHRLAEELFITYYHSVAKEKFDLISLSVSYTAAGESTSRIR